MDLIVWRETYETGNVRVDNQHKHLVELINELFNHLNSKDKDEKLKLIFTELYEYTANHFLMEEEIMQEHKYTGFLDHKEEHIKFVATVKEFKDRYFKGQAKINFELLNFLKDWLIKHILGTDKTTFAALKSRINK
jgi:hemerythrin-like metal-binding protein